ncbi:MAG: serine/threonine protein kinase, partial [Planctomycetia bacterium]
DIKPTNILIASSGAVKWVDFGLAGVVEGQGQKQNFSTEQRTVDYAGLEKATGAPIGDPRSDIFFLGTVFYHMLTGSPAMPETTDRKARLLRTRFDQIRKLSSFAAVPTDLARVVDKMLSFRLDGRYQNYDSLRDDLAGLSYDAEPRLQPSADGAVGGASGGGAAAEPAFSVDDLFDRPRPKPAATPRKPVFDPALFGAVDEPADAPVEVLTDNAVDEAPPSTVHKPTEPTVPLDAGTAAKGETRVDEPSPLEATSGKSDGAPRGAGVDRRPRVLVVLAGENTRKAVHVKLHARGYKVGTTGDVAQAAAACRIKRIDALVIDLEATGEKGAVEFALLTADPANACRAVFLADDAHLYWTKGLPADRCIVLPKPVKFTAVLESLAKLGLVPLPPTE